jgi:hypothetical protein
MKPEQHPSRTKSAPRGAEPGKGRTNPEWAEGLRKLYHDVVDEEIPEGLQDLLSKLDKGK